MPRADQQRAGQTRALGVADSLQIRSLLPRLFEYRARQGDEPANVVAGREFRDHAAIGLVHGDLGMNRLGEEPPVIKGDAGLIARGLDPKHQE